MSLTKISAPIILTVAALAVGSIVFALLSTGQTVSNSGNIRAVGVGVYKDSSCTQTLASIDWGALTPGSTRNYTCYVRNEGTLNLVLSRTTSNWNPSSTSSYMTLSWNREGYALNAGATVQAVFTLSVSSSITGIPSFTFDITITGTERV
jgi:hypothetical protein